MSARWAEWLGALTGLTGSALLSLNDDWSRWGFVVYLVSNLCWFVFGIRNRAWGLVLMQVGFTMTSLNGVVRWFGTS